MGKFKFLIILILALFLVCGIVMVVDAPSSFDDSVSLIPTSDSSVDADSSNCENGICLADSNKTNNSDLKHAFEDAKAHHRNVMIVFDGAACIYCEYLKEDTLTDSAVQKEINDNYIILITETSESPELSSQLSVYGTPTTVIFDENANELGRIEVWNSRGIFGSLERDQWKIILINGRL